ncbi:MAG: hypothetical protein RMJ17_01440 [Candidatus Aenigmarchaeota archaeon]|nr:hypothetical protein [Candidatus Aenigmarchaeota archaeon]MDW8149244.1 hypothetical protein [Candidatus Aenigmarchaeota archaeon]
MRFEDLLNEIRLIRSFLINGISFEQSLKIVSEKYPKSIFSSIAKSNKPMKEAIKEAIEKEKNERTKYCLEKIYEGLELETLGENLDLIVEKFSEEDLNERKNRIEFSKSFATFFIIFSIILPIVAFVFYTFLSVLHSLEFLNIGIKLDESFLYFFLFAIFLTECIMMFYYFKK